MEKHELLEIITIIANIKQKEKVLRKDREDTVRREEFIARCSKPQRLYISIIILAKSENTQLITKLIFSIKKYSESDFSF